MDSTEVINVTLNDDGVYEIFKPIAEVVKVIQESTKPKITSKDVLKNGGLLAEMIGNYQERTEQIALSEAIEDAINNGKNLLSEAPTGTGKSIAYLVPAILIKQRFVISTATKALQEQLYAKDIPLMQEAFAKIGIKFEAALMKGRGNYVSLRRYKENMKVLDPNDMWTHNRVSSWLNNTKTGDMDELDFVLGGNYRSSIQSTSDDCEGKECPFYNDCKFHNAKKKANNANIIIANHDLVAVDLMLKNTIGFGTLPAYDGLILDEAHHFEDVISKYLGFKLSKFVFRNLNGLIGRYFKLEKEYFETEEGMDTKAKLELLMKQMVKQSSKFFDNFYPDDDKDVTRLKPRHITTKVIIGNKKLTVLMDKIVNILSDAVITSEKSETVLENISKRLSDIYEKLNKVMDMDNLYEEWVYWTTTNNNDDVIVESAPISVAPYLKQWLYDRDDLETIKRREKANDTVLLKTVIMTSATVTTNGSFVFIKDRLGVEEAEEIVVDSVFDYPHQALTYIPKNIVEPVGGRDSAQTFTRLMAQNVIEILNITKGRAFVLFTSYSEMERVYNMTKNSINHTVLKQGEYSKSLLIDKFKQDVNSVLFATSSFWEGVDIQGEALSCVIIDKIPFPVPSEPLIEARIEAIKRNGGDWFNNFYIPIAIIALKQGYGRLIRTVEDLGMVAIMDKRIVTKNYGGKFLRSLPDSLKTRKIEKVELFFDIVEQKREYRKTK